MAEKVSLLDELDILVERGVYRDRETLMKDAVRSLLRSRPELRGQLALGLYKEKRVSLSRAAEIAGIDIESFKELLRDAGFARTIPPVGEAIQDELDSIGSVRRAD